MRDRFRNSSLEADIWTITSLPGLDLFWSLRSLDTYEDIFEKTVSAEALVYITFYRSDRGSSPRRPSVAVGVSDMKKLIKNQTQYRVISKSVKFGEDLIK